jgi:hypothetical protein
VCVWDALDREEENIVNIVVGMRLLAIIVWYTKKVVSFLLSKERGWWQWSYMLLGSYSWNR